MEVGDASLSYRYPHREGICWVPRQDVLAAIDITTQNHRTYFTAAADLDQVHALFQEVINIPSPHEFF